MPKSLIEVNTSLHLGGSLVVMKHNISTQFNEILS